MLNKMILSVATVLSISLMTQSAWADVDKRRQTFADIHQQRHELAEAKQELVKELRHHDARGIKEAKRVVQEERIELIFAKRDSRHEPRSHRKSRHARRHCHRAHR